MLSNLVSWGVGLALPLTAKTKIEIIKIRRSMNNLKWYERVIISTILTALAFIVCLFWKSDLWIAVGVGSFGYQIVDHMSDYLRK